MRFRFIILMVLSLSGVRAELPTIGTIVRDLTYCCNVPGTSLTNPTLFYATNTVIFGYKGTPVVAIDPTLIGPGYPPFSSLTNGISITATGLSSDVQAPVDVQFQHTGNRFEIRVFAGGGNIAISDGVNTTNLIAVPANGWPQWIPVNYSSNATRKIRIYLDPGIYFSGINVNAGDTIANVAAPQKKLLVLADSYGTGYDGSYGLARWTTSYPLLLANMGTNRHVIPSAVSGTGVLNPYTPPKTNYFGRFYSDVVAHNPDWLVIQMSINDAAWNATNSLGYFTACTNLFGVAKNIYGNRVVVCGVLDPYDTFGGASSGNANLNANSKAAAQSVGVTYFDALADNVLSPWSGNFSPDGIHPNLTGYTRIANYLNAKLFTTFGTDWDARGVGNGTVYYTLTVNNGTGSGSYTNGQGVDIAATPIVGSYFANWIGAAIANSNQATTTITMPASNLVVAANLIPLPAGPSFDVTNFGARGDAVRFAVQTTSNSSIVNVIGTNRFTSSDIGKIIQVFRAGPWLHFGNNVASPFVVTNQDTICLITNVTEGTNLYLSIPQGWTKNTYAIVGSNNRLPFQAAINAAQNQVVNGQRVTINIPDGNYLIVSANTLNPSYVCQNINGDGTHSLDITSGGLTFAGESTNAVLLSTGAGMAHALNSTYPYGELGHYTPLRGSLFFCHGPISNSASPLIFQNLTFEGGLTNGLQTYRYFTPIEGNGDGWDTGHHALVDFNPNGTVGDPRSQMHQMKVFTNCVFQHWRGEMLICTTGAGGTNTFNTIANCIFYDGNASANNLYYGQHVYGSRFEKLEKVHEYYQANATTPSIWHDNVWTNIYGNPFSIVGSLAAQNPPAFVISNNVCASVANVNQISFSPAENVTVVSNQFFGPSLGIVFTAVGLQPADGSASGISNIVIVGNSFNDTYLPIYITFYGVENLMISNNVGGSGPQFMQANGWIVNGVLANNKSGGRIDSTALAGWKYPLDLPGNTFSAQVASDTLGRANQITYARGRYHQISQAVANSVFYLDDSNPALIPNGAMLEITNTANLTVPIYGNSLLAGSTLVLSRGQARQFLWTNGAWRPFFNPSWNPILRVIGPGP